jgi:hypothetical protein
MQELTHLISILCADSASLRVADRTIERPNWPPTASSFHLCDGESLVAGIGHDILPRATRQPTSDARH